MKKKISVGWVILLWVAVLSSNLLTWGMLEGEALDDWDSIKFVLGIAFVAVFILPLVVSRFSGRETKGTALKVNDLKPGTTFTVVSAIHNHGTNHWIIKLEDKSFAYLEHDGQTMIEELKYVVLKAEDGNILQELKEKAEEN